MSRIEEPQPTYRRFEPRYFDYDTAPAVFSNWQAEQLSWKTGCYLHAGISAAPFLRMTGPDVTRMLHTVCVNDLDRLAVGSSTHMVICNRHGHVTGNGMLLREAEDTYMATMYRVLIDFAMSRGDFDVELDDHTGSRFIFQVAGPTSLAVLRDAFGEDFGDLRFLRHREAEDARRHLRLTQDDLHVLRLGMAGSLAYEVHGNRADAEAVYDAILEAGKPHGIRQMGSYVYNVTQHTENGFPNNCIHYVPGFDSDDEIMAFMRSSGALDGPLKPWPRLRGSMGPDMDRRHVTPYDLGWGHLVKFDHDFRGREALEPIAPAPPRQMVTLLWNPEDVAAVLAAALDPADDTPIMTLPGEDGLEGGYMLTLFSDEVRKDGVFVGMSSARMYSAYYRAMISLCPIAVEHAAIGTEVVVLWGDPGTRQREIRATVARYPFLDLERNERIETPGPAR